MVHKQLLWVLPMVGLMLTGFRSSFAQEAGSGALGWIGVVIALILLIPLVMWLRRSSETPTAENGHHLGEAAHASSRSLHPGEAETIVTTADITPQDLVEAVVDEAEEVVEDVMGEGDDTAAATQDKREEMAPDAEESGLDSVVETSRSAPSRGAQASPKSDDFTIIEGIGPKISRILQDQGINTFAELAAADPRHIEEILKEAGLSNIAKPGTWAEQAQMAAEAKWDELETLQNELKGGRRA